MRQIEAANPQSLYGIFGDTQWSNKERLPDSLLRDLIEHFSKVPLGNRVAGSPRRPLSGKGRRRAAVADAPLERL